MNKRMAVVLAAGKGTRMKSNQLKVLHKINGITMIEHTVRAVRKAGVDQVVTIIGTDGEEIQQVLTGQSECAIQEKQLGTAHAVLQAKSILEGQPGTTLVVNGDGPLLTGETLERLYDFHEQSGASGTVLTAIASLPNDYGRIVRDEAGNVQKIVETKDCDEKEIQITEVNSGVFIFDNQKLFELLDQVDNNNAQGEYYLPDVIGLLQGRGEMVKAYVTEQFDEIIGINDRQRLAEVTRIMNQRIMDQHMDNGVTFVLPESTYVEVDVEIGNDTVIEPGVQLKGKTRIGSNCTIGAHSVIEDSQLGDEVVVRQSVIELSQIAQQATIGPFAHLRPETVLDEGVHIGNFVEVKKSELGAHTKAGHLTYIGDATIGRNVNIGCGTVIANYDGKKKHHSTIGDECFIGSGSVIVSPVQIGDHAVTAAGSTITEDVPDESLGIGRVRQTTKSNFWQKFMQK